MASEPVISFFKKGKLFVRGLPFLQFCKKYDICNHHEVTSGCCFGKISIHEQFLIKISKSNHLALNRTYLVC